MKLLITTIFSLTLSACGQYQLVKQETYTITETVKDMQDYACREHRGVKKYTKADYVPCNARDIWIEW